MRKFLACLQKHIQHRLKPATPTPISGLLSDLARSRIDLPVENALLRQQLMVLNRQGKRPPLTNPDRFRFVLLETIAAYYSTGHLAALASGTVSSSWAAEVARQGKDFGRNDQADPQASQGESLVGSRADPR